MAAESAGSLVCDVRRLLQDVVTPDLKALATKVDGLEGQLGRVHARLDGLEADIHRLDERKERRFDRLTSALDVYKDVQDLKEFRIRMEERQKASA